MVTIAIDGRLGRPYMKSAPRGAHLQHRLATAAGWGAPGDITCGWFSGVPRKERSTVFSPIGDVR